MTRVGLLIKTLLCKLLGSVIKGTNVDYWETNWRRTKNQILKPR